MIRIAGVNIPENKRAVIALTYIKGIGRSRAEKILSQVGVDMSKRAKDVEPEKVEAIRQVIEKNFTVEGDLRVETNNNIKRLKNIDSYRGYRHSRNLPVRGQRTKTNARTKRGKKMTVGSGRKKSADKT